MTPVSSPFGRGRIPELIGLGLGRPSCGKGKDGRIKFITVLRHSNARRILAITLDGLPLGLAAIKFWTRKQFKGCEALKRKINPTRVPIEEKESFRWLKHASVHCLDRQSP